MSNDANNDNKRHIDGFVPFAGQQQQQQKKKTKQSQSPKPLATTSLTMTQLSAGTRAHSVIDDTLFNDAIYSTVKMDALCVAIINTKQFQRLAHLKQLGTCRANISTQPTWTWHHSCWCIVRKSCRFVSWLGTRAFLTRIWRCVHQAYASEWHWSAGEQMAPRGRFYLHAETADPRE